MRVFISADIEGVSGTVSWEQLRNNPITSTYQAACQEMTREVAAACQGAIAAGADYILVNDAHDVGQNLDPNGLPDCVELVRGSSGSPWSMANGVQEGFDAAMFVGYHQAAGLSGNPLSHTFSTKTHHVLLNGKPCSEFMIYSYAAAMAGVPTVLLTGDERLCQDSAHMHPLLKTVAVKRGDRGGASIGLSPAVACDRIRHTAQLALSQDLSAGLITLPESFTFEICYKEHTNAYRCSSFPGFSLVDDTTIRTTTTDYYDVMRAVKWLL
jgi:D-amino peptidase